MRFERWNESSNDSDSGKKSDAASDVEKMMLLYLPGIEGLGTSVEPQLPALSAKFDVFRLVMGAEDRSTFSTLSRAVSFFFSSKHYIDVQTSCPRFCTVLPPGLIQLESSLLLMRLARSACVVFPVRVSNCCSRLDAYPN